MKRTYLFAVLIYLCSSLINAQITIRTTNNIPKVHLQDRTRYTCNPDNILSQAACDSIDRLLYALEEHTGIETVVVVVGSIGDTDCFDFAYQLGQEWGVGKAKNDNGLVILLVINQRCIQFATGYGLEGDLPDAICKRIQTRYMIPYLKNNRWDEGMIIGVQAVCKQLEGSMTNQKVKEENSGHEAILIMAVLLGLFIIGIGLIWWGIQQASKCPHCGKHKLQRSDTILLYRRGGVKKEEITYICHHCGHIVKRQQSNYDEHYRGGSGPVIFGGSMGRNFGSGGGFGGGSFGGGSFGGGGAGSRF
ncbi:MAG: TPM domain-containing protein [Mediterranea massiliensis]|nr:TPM domain-containing protein [Mediterranea massiliensis]